MTPAGTSHGKAIVGAFSRLQGAEHRIADHVGWAPFWTKQRSTRPECCGPKYGEVSWWVCDAGNLWGENANAWWTCPRGRRSCRLDLGSERARSRNARGRGSRRWGRRCGTDRLHRWRGHRLCRRPPDQLRSRSSSAATVMRGIAARATARPAPRGAPRSANISVVLATSGRARITATTDSA